MLCPRLLAAACFLIGVSACAKGDPLGTGGNSSGGHTSQGGDANGGAGIGGDPTTPSSNTVTTGPMCAEQPCTLVEPQCGCDVGFGCTVDDAGMRECLSAGSATEGQACSADNLCTPGAICVGYTTDLLSCSKFCNTNAECTGPGGQCVLELTGAPGVLLCSENCNLVGSQGCLLGGTSCQLGLTDSDVAYTLCAPTGAGVEQAICTDSGDCAPGFVCLGTTEMPPQNRCFQWCDPANAATCNPNFPNCNALELSAGVPLTIGTTTYGACNP